MSVYFSMFIAELLKEFIKKRPKWKSEMPLVIENIHVGFQLMDADSNRAMFVAFKQKEGEPFVGVSVAMDILKMCKQLKIPLIIAYDKKFYGVKSSNLQWEEIYGMQSTNSGVLFQKVNLTTICAELLGEVQPAQVAEGEK